MEQIIEGTSEEIKESHEATLAGHKVMVIVDPVEPSNTYQNEAQLDELLIEGLDSNMHRATQEFWQEQHNELDRKFKARPK